METLHERGTAEDALREKRMSQVQDFAARRFGWNDMPRTDFLGITASKLNTLLDHGNGDRELCAFIVERAANRGVELHELPDARARQANDESLGVGRRARSG